MDDKKVTVEEMESLLAGDFRRFAEQMAAAMNDAKAGSIIDDSEIPVFEASGALRQRAFEKALSLVQAKHEAFSPSAQRDA
jgi:predicted RecA/RadA family phage recombinase